MDSPDFGVVGPDLVPALDREGGVGQNVVLGIVQQRRHTRERSRRFVGDPSPLVVCAGDGGLGKTVRICLCPRKGGRSRLDDMPQLSAGL